MADNQSTTLPRARDCDQVEENETGARKIGKLDIKEHQPQAQPSRQRKVGKLNMVENQSQEQPRELRQIGKLDIHETHPEAEALPSGESKFKRNGVNEEAPADYEPRSWQRRGNVPANEMDAIGSRPVKESTANDKTVLDQSKNENLHGMPFNDEEESKSTEQRVVSRLNIIEYRPVTQTLPTGEYKWKKQSDQEAHKPDSILENHREEPNMEFDAIDAAKTKPSTGTDDMAWAFQLIDDLGGEVDGPISDIQWANEGEVLKKLQVVMKVEENRRAVDIQGMDEIDTAAEDKVNVAGSDAMPAAQMQEGTSGVDNINVRGTDEVGSDPAGVNDQQDFVRCFFGHRF